MGCPTEKSSFSNSDYWKSRLPMTELLANKNIPNGSPFWHRWASPAATLKMEAHDPGSVGWLTPED